MSDLFTYNKKSSQLHNIDLDDLSEVALSATSGTVKVGESVDVDVTINRGGGLTVSSNNNDIATVTSTGNRVTIN